MCLCSEPMQRKPQRGAAEGRPPLWRRPKPASVVLALNKARVLALNTAHVLLLNKADVLALNTAHVLCLNSKICPVFSQSYRTTCFVFFKPLSAKTPALLRRKTCAVLRARTCALFRANTKEAAFGRPPLWLPLYWL